MMTIKINGKELPIENMRQWESKRRTWSARFLKRKLGGTQGVESKEKFLKFKIETSEADMRRALKRTLAVSSFFAKAAVLLSCGKRKLCVTELEIADCSAEYLCRGLSDMMLNNTDENREHCLAACPEHYLLKGCDEQTQEVIEVAGSMPLPLQFFAVYGDESGLTSPRDSNYPFQLAGVARLKSGLVMGGVRHQMRNIEGGCAVRLTVEFPALLPNRYIREHQLHLACEFYNWFDVLSKREPC